MATVEYLSTQISKEIRIKESALGCQFSISKKYIKKHLRGLLTTTLDLNPDFPNAQNIPIQEDTLRTYLNTYIKPFFKFLIGKKSFTHFKNACIAHLNPTIKIYVDASYMPDSGEIGIGMVITSPTSSASALGCYEVSINKHGSYWAELKGIHQALVCANHLSSTNPDAKIEIYSDCESVILALQSTQPPSTLFKRAKKIFRKSIAISSHLSQKLSINWVRGHADDKLNILADQLATQARITKQTPLTFVS